MRAIITGPTGAIGTALIQRLLEKGNDVLAICHKDSRKIAMLPVHSRLQIMEANLNELCVVKERIQQKYDVFYHMAWAGTTGRARNDMMLQIDNIKYTLDAVELANKSGCHTFIGAGSQAEFGRVEGILRVDTPTFPENGYGMAKLCAGQMSGLRCEQLGIRHIWVRILSVYGPNDGQNSMIMSTIQKLLAGERAGVTPAEQIWDYLYSSDAAEAMYLLAQNGRTGKKYVLGSGKAVPLKQYIEQIYEAVKEEKEKVGQLGIGDYGYSDKQVMHLEADISELYRDTGFTPSVSFQDGIRRTVRWLMREKHLWK